MKKNGFILSGAIVNFIDQEIISKGKKLSKPIKIGTKFTDLHIEGNDITFYEGTCNRSHFFLLYNNDGYFLEMFKIDDFTNKPARILGGCVKFNIDPSCDIKNRNISLFCSENYIFCSIKYKKEANKEKKDWRFIYFAIIDKNTETLIEKKIKDYQIPNESKAFDFTGNNNNFAFFCIEDNEDNDYAINTFSSSSNWELEKIKLPKPTIDTEFFYKNYIKMAYKGKDLFLIGDDQRFIRNIYCLKYSNSDPKNYITNIFTVDGNDLLRIINQPKRELICDSLILTDDHIIQHENKFIYDSNEITYIQNISLPIQYKNEKNEQWILSKRSCVFLSSIYFDHIEEEENSEEEIPYEDDTFENFKKIGDLSKNKHKSNPEENILDDNESETKNDNELTNSSNSQSKTDPEINNKSKTNAEHESESEHENDDEPNNEPEPANKPKSTKNEKKSATSQNKSGLKANRNRNKKNKPKPEPESDDEPEPANKPKSTKKAKKSATTQNKTKLEDNRNRNKKKKPEPEPEYDDDDNDDDEDYEPRIKHTRTNNNQKTAKSQNKHEQDDNRKNKKKPKNRSEYDYQSDNEPEYEYEEDEGDEEDEGSDEEDYEEYETIPIRRRNTNANKRETKKKTKHEYSDDDDDDDDDDDNDEEEEVVIKKKKNQDKNQQEPVKNSKTNNKTSPNLNPRNKPGIRKNHRSTK